MKDKERPVLSVRGCFRIGNGRDQKIGELRGPRRAVIRKALQALPAALVGDGRQARNLVMKESRETHPGIEQRVRVRVESAAGWWEISWRYDGAAGKRTRRPRKRGGSTPLPPRREIEVSTQGGTSDSNRK